MNNFNDLPLGVGVTLSLVIFPLLFENELIDPALLRFGGLFAPLVVPLKVLMSGLSVSTRSVSGLDIPVSGVVVEGGSDGRGLAIGYLE